MYTTVTIVSRRLENPETTTLFFDQEFSAVPGQFAMVWIPGVGEKPYSFSYPNGITVKKVGPFSSALADLKEGTRLSLRGPLGTGFPPFNGSWLLIGGGCGMAPLRFLAQTLPGPTILLGAKTSDGILFLKEFQERGQVKVTTEDGSLGKKGLVTDLLPAESKFAAICGPEPMMAACLSRLHQPKANIFMALERYMKCAIGLCGTCSCSGYRVCVDGPVFDAASIEDMPDFNTRGRTRSGRYEVIRGEPRWSSGLPLINPPQTF